MSFRLTRLDRANKRKRASNPKRTARNVAFVRHRMAFGQSGVISVLFSLYLQPLLLAIILAYWQFRSCWWYTIIHTLAELAAKTPLYYRHTIQAALHHSAVTVSNNSRSLYMLFGLC